MLKQLNLVEGSSITHDIFIYHPNVMTNWVYDGGEADVESS